MRDTLQSSGNFAQIIKFSLAFLKFLNCSVTIASLFHVAI